jgi:hypothetical protein
LPPSNSIIAYLPNSIAQAAYDAAYNTTGKAQVAELHSAGVQAINAAATTMPSPSALSTAKSRLNSVQTAAQMTAAALASAKPPPRQSLMPMAMRRLPRSSKSRADRRQKHRQHQY